MFLVCYVQEEVHLYGEEISVDATEKPQDELEVGIEKPSLTNLNTKKTKYTLSSTKHRACDIERRLACVFFSFVAVFLSLRSVVNSALWSSRLGVHA